MSETTHAADVKILTRNPLIPWKRLVEMNLNSMFLSNGTGTKNDHSYGFNVCSGSVPEYHGHEMSESNSNLRVSDCCYKCLVTENSKDNLDGENPMVCYFEREQNEFKRSLNEKHNKAVCLNDGTYTGVSTEVRPANGHYLFDTTETDFKPSDFKIGVNKLTGRDTRTKDTIVVHENEIKFEQEDLTSTDQADDCFKNVASCLGDQNKISYLNYVVDRIGKIKENAAIGDKISECSLVCDTKKKTLSNFNIEDVNSIHGTLCASLDDEYTYDAYSEKNCSRFEDSGIITHTDGLQCSLPNNTIRETDIDGESDWCLSFDDETCLEICSDEDEGAAVLPKEICSLLTRGFLSEGLSDVPLESHLRELEASRRETMNKEVKICTLQEIVADGCLVEDQDNNYLNRSAWQPGYYCTDQDDYLQPSSLLISESKVGEICDTNGHSDILSEVTGTIISPISEQIIGNYHWNKETGDSICTDNSSEIVKTLSLFKRHVPDSFNDSEIIYYDHHEQENKSQDVAEKFRDMADLNACIDYEPTNTDTTVDYSCDIIIGGEKCNHMGKCQTTNVCIIEKNQDVLPSSELTDSDSISSTKSITINRRKIIMHSSGELGSEWEPEECENENKIRNEEFGDFKSGDRHISDEFDCKDCEEDMHTDTSSSESHSQRGWLFDYNCVENLKTHEFNVQESQNTNLKRLTRNPLTSWKRLVEINIESMLATKQDCVDSAGHPSRGESKQIVKYPGVVNKPDSHVQTNSASHLGTIYSGDKFKLLAEMDANYRDMDSNIFNLSSGALTPSDTKIYHDVRHEDLLHDVSPYDKIEVIDDDLKDHYKSCSETAREIRGNVSHDNLSQSSIEMSTTRPSGYVDIFSDQEKTEKDIFESNQFDSKLNSPPADIPIPNMASEIVSLSLDTNVKEKFDSFTSLQANGQLSDDRSESQTRSEKKSDDKVSDVNQLSLMGKINSSITDVRRNLRKHVRTRQEKFEDWNSANKITVAKWLNRTGKCGKKECNILLSTANQPLEYRLRLLSDREVSERCSTESREKSHKLENVHSIPETQFKTQLNNTKLYNHCSEGNKPINTFVLESRPHEVVSEHQIHGVEVTIDGPHQNQSLEDDYISNESNQTRECCKKEDSYSLNDACVRRGAQSSRWTWLSNVVTKMVSSIKSSEYTRDEDMESYSKMTDDEGLQGEVNTVEVFLRNYQSNQSEMYKPVMENGTREVFLVETNRTNSKELQSEADMPFTAYISRHGIDNDFIRKSIDSTKTRPPWSAKHDSDDDMATAVQMTVDPSRSVRNLKLKTAYAFIRGMARTSSAEAAIVDRSSAISTFTSKSEQSFDEIINKFEDPENTLLKLKNNRVNSLLKRSKNVEKRQYTFNQENTSEAKNIQNSKRISNRRENGYSPSYLNNHVKKSLGKKIIPPRNVRMKTPLDKDDICERLTEQCNDEVGYSSRNEDASLDESRSGEYSSEIQFTDTPGSSTDGCVIYTQLVSNKDVLSEYFKSQEHNIKPMVTTKDAQKIPLFTLTLPSAPHHQTTQDAIGTRYLISSPVSGMTRAVSIDVMSVDTMESGDAYFRDDLFQSSLECLLEMLLQRGKVNHAFVATTDGEILAKTSGLIIPTDDVMTLICSLTSNYSGSVKISLMTFTYTCFKDDLKSALIGKAENSMFVAQLGNKNIVVGFTDPCIPGSCIREIQELSTALSHRGL